MSRPDAGSSPRRCRAGRSSRSREDGAVPAAQLEVRMIRIVGAARGDVRTARRRRTHGLAGATRAHHCPGDDRTPSATTSASAPDLDRPSAVLNTTAGPGPDLTSARPPHRCGRPPGRASLDRGGCAGGRRNRSGDGRAPAGSDPPGHGGSRVCLNPCARSPRLTIVGAQPVLDRAAAAHRSRAASAVPVPSCRAGRAAST